MDFRTFYDRAETPPPQHREQNSGEVVVVPNLTLSLREIYERWRRNEPLDIMTRNGTYLLDGDAEDFDAVDTDRGDITEVEEYLELRAPRGAFVTSEDIATRQSAADTGQASPGPVNTNKTTESNHVEADAST